MLVQNCSVIIACISYFLVYQCTGLMLFNCSAADAMKTCSHEMQLCVEWGGAPTPASMHIDVHCVKISTHSMNSGTWGWPDVAFMLEMSGAFMT